MQRVEVVRVLEGRDRLPAALGLAYLALVALGFPLANLDSIVEQGVVCRSGLVLADKPFGEWQDLALELEVGGVLPSTDRDQVG